MRIPLDGDSMRPLIRRGRDMVTFVPLTRPLQRGDVVLFEYPAGDMWRIAYSAYRLNMMKTLGDHCWNPEPWLPVSAALGLAIQVERGRLTIPLDCPFMRAPRAHMDGAAPPAPRILESACSGRERH